MMSSMLTCNDLALVLGFDFEAFNAAEVAATTGTRVSSTSSILAGFFVTPFFAATLRGFLPCGISWDISGTSCSRNKNGARPLSGTQPRDDGEIVQL